MVHIHCSVAVYSCSVPHTFVVSLRFYLEFITDVMLAMGIGAVRAELQVLLKSQDFFLSMDSFFLYFN